ncbi:MAG: toll/interleukin-1 receptor domain-containing protein [Polyangia bacterium]
MTDLLVTLPRRELRVLDTVAKCQFSKAEPIGLTELLLEHPPGSENFVGEVVQVLLGRLLLASGEGPGTGTLSLTPLGLLSCSYTSEASSLAEGILRYIQQRLGHEKSKFKGYTWDEMKSSGVVAGDERFGYAVAVVSLFNLAGEHSHSLGPPPTASWGLPPDVIALRGIIDIVGLYQRVEGKVQRNNAAADHQGERQMFDELMPDTMTIHKSDGQTLEAVRGQVSPGLIMVMDGSLVIEVGDIAERLASNGLREFYAVTATGFHEKVSGIPAHYQMKVRPISAREFQRSRDAKAESSTGDGLPNPTGNTPIRIFISHSSADVQVASALIDLLRSALNLPSSDIRCTSVDGFGLEGGANTEESLRREVRDSELFIGVISEHSLTSVYALFELGARWGTERPLIPLLAPGTPPDVLSGPLSNIHALNLGVEAQIHQLVSQVAKKLNVPSAPPAVYSGHLRRLATATPSTPSIFDNL